MNPDPLSTNENPMSYKDAAIVATVLMLTITATVFMPTHGYEVYLTDPDRFYFDLATFLFSSWITIFASLTGLTFYAKHQTTQDGSGGE